jgi:hypothetical protein
VLGPLLFSFFIKDIPGAWSQHGAQGVLYADDIQLYIRTSLDDIAAAIDKLEKSVHETNLWLCSSGLFLNVQKTEFIALSSKMKSSSLLAIPLRVGNMIVKSKACVRDLGVMVDNHLSMDSHVLKVTKSAFFFLRMIGKVRRYLSPFHATLLVHALALSRIEFCASLFLGIKKKSMKKLQRIIHYAMRLVEGGGRWVENLSTVPKRRKWPSVEDRAKFRLSVIAYTALTAGMPHALAAQLEPVRSTGSDRTLRSHTQGQLNVPRVKSAGGKRAFAVAAPILLNSLPQAAREGNSRRKSIMAIRRSLLTGD